MSVSRSTTLPATLAWVAAAALIAVALPVFGTMPATADDGQTPPPPTATGHPWDGHPWDGHPWDGHPWD